MIARELIERLQEINPETPILIETIQEVDGMLPASYRDISVFKIVENVKIGVLGDGSWGAGQHVLDNLNNPNYPDIEPVQAVVLSNR